MLHQQIQDQRRRPRRPNLQPNHRRNFRQNRNVAISSPSDDRVAIPRKRITFSVSKISVATRGNALVVHTTRRLKVRVPHFYSRPLLSPITTYHVYLVRVRKRPGPRPTYTVPITSGVVIHARHASGITSRTRHNIVRFLLLGRPLSYPVYSGNKRYPLRGRTVATNHSRAQFRKPGHAFPGPVGVDTRVLLSQRQYISYTHYAQFTSRVTKSTFVSLLRHNTRRRIKVDRSAPFSSCFTNGAIRVYPIKTLAGTHCQFQTQPFSLMSIPAVYRRYTDNYTVHASIQHNRIRHQLTNSSPRIGRR